MKIDLLGKNTIVGSGAIGLAIVETLAKAGAQMTVFDVKLDALVPTSRPMHPFLKRPGKAWNSRENGRAVMSCTLLNAIPSGRFSPSRKFYQLIRTIMSRQHKSARSESDRRTFLGPGGSRCGLHDANRQGCLGAHATKLPDIVSIHIPACCMFQLEACGEGDHRIAGQRGDS